MNVAIRCYKVEKGTSPIRVNFPILPTKIGYFHGVFASSQSWGFQDQVVVNHGSAMVKNTLW
jgi:hypothetical protein